MLAVAITVSIDINGPGMCVDSEIPLLLGLIVLGERAHWDLCLRSSETL